MKSNKDERTPYWIWLSLILGQGNNRLEKVLSRYFDPKNLYECRGEISKYDSFFTDGEKDRIGKITLEQSSIIIEKTFKKRFHIVCYNDEDFPACLKELPDCPCVLYVDGTLPHMGEKLNIGIVGTRHPTVHGCNAALTITAGLVKSGVTIISGFAVGIDEFAHRAVLQNDGIGIAVLGCGLDVNYPHQLNPLRELIKNKGALISEYPVETAANGRNFPVRNRLISGLSEGIVVVQAPSRSGSLITAKWALDQGKDVFAVPDSIFEPNSKGSNKLIKDGASLTTDASDIISSYLYRYGDRITEYTQNEEKNQTGSDFSKYSYGQKPRFNNQDLSDEELKLYENLSAEPVTVEVLCGKAGLSIQNALCILTQLEIDGVAKAYPGRRYGLIRME